VDDETWSHRGDPGHRVAAPSAEPSAPGPATVVVVTDNDGFARALCDRLERTDEVSVLGVMAHMSTAVTFTGRRDPRIVLVDLTMHGIVEEDLVRGLRAAAPTSVIIAANGSGSVEEESDVRGAGADVYLSSRLSLDDLVVRLTG
jgi:DNA-binding response OmpR family regulator